MQKIRLFWHKISSKAWSWVVNLFAYQTNFDMDETVLLIGSTRSGTTFLMESLNTQNEYRLIFEPFNPTYTKEWSAFSARHFINPSKATELERNIIDRILRGKIKNNWVDRYNRKIRSNKRLIKAVRANLLLEYFETAYPDLQIIYIHRNPFEVVASRMKLRFDPKDVFLILKHSDFIKKHYDDIDITALQTLLTTPEACHTALWCFENRFIIRSLKTRSIIEVNYEEVIGKTVLLQNGRLEILDTIRKPSVSTSFEEPYQLSEMELKNVRQILNFFTNY